MRLKKDINLTAFFLSVQKCQGDVWFQSDEGDRLNLKSQLCQYVFLAAFLDKKIALSGMIVCERQQDAQMLRDFTEA